MIDLIGIEAKCRLYKIDKYHINSDGSVDVNGDVTITGYSFKELPIVFNNINGIFNCSRNALTTLKGSPKYVLDGFYCDNNSLTSFDGCPEYMPSFSCSSNLISTLEGCPQIYEDNVYIFIGNKFPEIVNDHLLHIDDNQEKVNIFVKYHMHYGVWENGFNEEAFLELIQEIDDGLE